jgi:hypothetical protein
VKTSNFTTPTLISNSFRHQSAVTTKDGGCCIWVTSKNNRTWMCFTTGMFCTLTSTETHTSDTSWTSSVSCLLHRRVETYWTPHVCHHCLISAEPRVWRLLNLTTRLRSEHRSLIPTEPPRVWHLMNLYDCHLLNITVWYSLNPTRRTSIEHHATDICWPPQTDTHSTSCVWHLLNTTDIPTEPRASDICWTSQFDARYTPRVGHLLNITRLTSAEHHRRIPTEPHASDIYWTSHDWRLLNTTDWYLLNTTRLTSAEHHSLPPTKPDGTIRQGWCHLWPMHWRGIEKKAEIRTSDKRKSVYVVWDGTSFPKLSTSVCPPSFSVQIKSSVHFASGKVSFLSSTQPSNLLQPSVCSMLTRPLEGVTMFTQEDRYPAAECDCLHS